MSDTDEIAIDGIDDGRIAPNGPVNVVPTIGHLSSATHE